MTELAGYLPGLPAGEAKREMLRFAHAAGPVEVAVPVLGAEEIAAMAARIRAGGRAGLKRLDVGEVVAAIDRVVARFLDRGDPLRRRAEDLIPRVTGYDAEMVRLGLTRYFKTFRAPELRRFLAEDFADPGILDGFRPRPKGGMAKAVGPDLLLHVWAGNVPGLPLWSLICGLLVKAGTVGKVASAEPLMAGWFAEALAETEPRLAESLAIVWWRGGEEAPERAWLAEAETVVAYGGNRALGELRARLPVTARLVQHGHRISLGMVAREALTTRMARAVAHDAALDIVRYEQQGCYSPQVFYVERGGGVGPADFARYLASALQALSRKYPRRPLSLEEGAALAAWRGGEETAALSGAGAALIGEHEDEWAVAFSEAAQGLGPSGLNRTVRVVALDRLEDAADALAPARAFLQTVGLAAAPERLFELAEMLAAAGATRICALGAMTAPEAGWHNDGRFNLADLVAIAEIEHSAETAAEAFASYAD